ncbi:MAG: sigma 54-interacting transcriptional regulator [Rhodospirillales bacterium]|nr:sigma 54-interacting transcriptional regulator [Rhodospirillales bacterium]
MTEAPLAAPRPIDKGRLATGRLAQTDDSLERAYPDIGDLAARLRFAFRDGRIWFDNQRVALVHLSTLESLRRELIDTLGAGEARGFLTRMGYSSGARDATLARKLRPNHALRDAFLVGPQLRILQGVVSMEPVRLEIDVAAGHFLGEFVWPESFEVDSHLSTYGPSSAPVCWMQIGYACGYASTFLGRPVLFKEMECRASGAPHCRALGKPIEQWDDIDADLAALQPAPFANRFTARRRSTGPAAAREAVVLDDLVGVSAGFVGACHLLTKVADTDATVLFLGETGVGKERFAHTLHRIGRRADKPFVAVNCAAIPDNLIESELFGVEKGAFTGALASRPGRFERAHGGTLFLDEVGALSLPAQVKLLRALQSREIERVGDRQTRHVDIRLVAATNLDLDRAVARGEFRDDLLFRLNIFPIRIPPLRERRDDIPLLLDHFLHTFATLHRREVTGFTETAIQALYDYDYPGNIRELENLIERAVILSDGRGAPIDLCHLQTMGRPIAQAAPSGPVPPESADDPAAAGKPMVERLLETGLSIEAFEDELMDAAVNRAGGNLARAARMLGLTRPQLAYRLKRKGNPAVAETATPN